MIRLYVALGAWLLIGSVPCARAEDSSLVQAVILSLARTQLALERCPDLKPGWAREEMPKAAGLSPDEIKRGVTAAMSRVRQEMEQTGDRLCDVAMTIHGPDGNYMPYYLDRR